MIAQLPSFVRFITKQNAIWSKALIMPLDIWHCVLSYQENTENGHVLPRNYSHNRIPRLQLFATNNFKQVANGIFRWQICYLLLLISNPEYLTHCWGQGGWYNLFPSSTTSKSAWWLRLRQSHCYSYWKPEPFYLATASVLGSVQLQAENILKKKIGSMLKYFRRAVDSLWGILGATAK